MMQFLGRAGKSGLGGRPSLSSQQLLHSSDQKSANFSEYEKQFSALRNRKTVDD